MKENFPNGGGDSIHKQKKNEDYVLQGIDNSLKSQIFSRDDKSPNSLISYWNKINADAGVPTKKEEQIDYYLLQMEQVKLDGYKPDKIFRDKDYVEKSINIDFENIKSNPTRAKEKVLERVYAHCLSKVFLERDVFYGGNEEEISLSKSTQAHPYDLNKRHVQQVLSIEDKRYPGQKFDLGIGVQWGHENTDDEAIDNRLSFVVNGITDWGSTTEVCYTSTDEKQAMPVNMPFVIVGGDLKRMSNFVDLAMKGEYNEAAKSSIVYNSLTQMKSQIDLFYQIALEHQKNLSNMQTPVDEYKKMKFMLVKDKLHETVSLYASMKNILDQVVEANAPSIDSAQTDFVNDKIQVICKEIAKRNNVSI